MSLNSWEFYTPVGESTSNAENMDYIDSMTEFLVENVMGFSKDTFHDKANCDNTSKQQNTTHLDLKWTPNSILILNFNELVSEIINIIPQNEALINLYYKEVPVKPPQFFAA